MPKKGLIVEGLSIPRAICTKDSNYVFMFTLSSLAAHSAIDSSEWRILMSVNNWMI